MLQLLDYDAIIFDFGGVILDLDYHATRRAFEELCGCDWHALYSQQQQTALFDDFETGRIDPATFRDSLRQLLGQDLSDRAIDTAWNAMLGGVPLVHVKFLEQLRSQRPIFLLSNTNAIHQEAFEQRFIDDHGDRHSSLPALFEQAYYSHHLGDRKPHASIFQTVIDRHQLDPSRTLFLDDSPQHLEGAKQAGLHTAWIPSGQLLEQVQL
ncbi:HAD family hydrolase [Synechococcus elongatus]|uniref:HAD family hydrolase n=1 Tax=Synechococcus elongatus TaxID=32046 RepID=UPI000F7F2B0B|nr:HAD family phosphatase [Synechococcus elongatus]